MITITQQPITPTEEQPFGKEQTLSVQATSSIGAELTYQWYYFDLNEETSTIIDGATSEDYIFVIYSRGGWFCRITEAGGESVDSDIAEIYVICKYCNDYTDIGKKCNGKYGEWCVGCLVECENTVEEEQTDFNPSDYQNLDSNQGVEFKSNMSSNILSGISLRRLDVPNLITTVKNELKKSIDEHKTNPHLNPQGAEEQEIFDLFTTYGLNVSSSADQEQFKKLQKFEHKNFSEYVMTRWLAKLLEPIDQALQCIQQYLYATRGVVVATATEDLAKGSLINLYMDKSYLDPNTGEPLVLARLADCIAHNNDNPPYNTFRMAHGFVSENYKISDCCIVLCSGINSLWNWEDDPTIYYTIGNRLWLGESGQISEDPYSELLPPDWTLCDQEVGYILSATKMFYQYLPPEDILE